MFASKENRDRFIDSLWSDNSGMVIIKSRYGKSYSNAEWFAIPTWNLDWVEDSRGGDVDCYVWWALDYRYCPVGRGDTPNEALNDLERVLDEGKEAYIKVMDEFWEDK